MEYLTKTIADLDVQRLIALKVSTTVQTFKRVSPEIPSGQSTVMIWYMYEQE